MLFDDEIDVILVTRTRFFPFIFWFVFVVLVFSKLSLLVVNDDALVKDRPSSFPPVPPLRTGPCDIGSEWAFLLAPGQTALLFLWGPLASSPSSAVSSY